MGPLGTIPLRFMAVFGESDLKRVRTCPKWNGGQREDRSFIVKSTITRTSRMVEVKNLASSGVGLVPPEMSIYFWA